MLSQPLLAKLRQLGLTGFQAALDEQQRNPQCAELPFEGRLGMMIDRECTHRQDNSLRRRIKAAGFAPWTASRAGCRPAWKTWTSRPGAGLRAASSSSWHRASGSIAA
jgi:phage-related baseplate assembly protein